MSRSQRALFRLMSPFRRAWVRAALTERDQAEDAATRERWSHAVHGMLFRYGVLYPLLRLVATVAAIALVAFLNQSPSDDADKTVLLAIVVLSFGLGATWYRFAWLPGVAVGITVAVAHLVSLAFRLPEPPMYLPPGWWSTTSLLILVLPAMAAAYGGAGVRHLLRRSRRPTT